jgi:hypothetical protein
MRLGTMFLALAGSFPQAVFAVGPALMPMPAKVQPTSGKLAINANFVVETVGAAGTRLAPAVKSFLDRVSRQAGVIYANSPRSQCRRHWSARWFWPDERRSGGDLSQAGDLRRADLPDGECRSRRIETACRAPRPGRASSGFAQDFSAPQWFSAPTLNPRSCAHWAYSL